MKKFISGCSVLLFLVLISFNSYSLCISCGCSGAYKKCLKDVDGVESGELSMANHHKTEKECKEYRRACHGEGIKIQIL